MNSIKGFFNKIITRRQKLDKSKLSARFLFFGLGILSTLWFLIRVIPKPSRAGYPCMQAAAPFASSFIIYLLSITTGTFFLKKSYRALLGKKIVLATGLIAAMVFAYSLSLFTGLISADAGEQKFMQLSEITPNNPIGEAKGLFPGRVVWIHNADATNENWTPESIRHATDDSNVDQEVVNGMLSRGIRSLAQSNTESGAWDKLFRHFNSTHGRGEQGYSPGEKIAIKINLTNNGRMWGERVDATPQVVYAILDQLVNKVGISQENITIGDPYRGFSQVYIDKCTGDFPNVNYVGKEAGGGVIQTVPSTEKVLKFSDGKETSSLPQFYLDADYFINIPILKSHDSGGITIAAKNHQGSVLQPGGTANNQTAKFMHYSFPNENNTPGYKKYRHLVDYMGHEQLGGKTLLYLVDGLWAGHNWRGIVRKWEMAPFNNDYPNSLFLAQDPVAIESVCYDFLLEEYREKTSEKYPYIFGTDDYILQAADPSYWPDDINYDPEGDGTLLGSLGVHEHWNNASDKNYTRNLETGSGIELYKVYADTELPDFSGTADPANYEARKASVAPFIDGYGNEECWALSSWAPISIDWFAEAGLNPPSFDENDFSGQFKAVWTPGHLYLLIQITDDVLNDDIADPLNKYYDEDCVEIFIDEDNSGGEHRNNANAWAYHTSPVTYDVVDLNESGKPQLYNEHLDFMVTSDGTTYTYEYRIKIYDDNYQDSSPESSRVELQADKIMGFSIAYCEDDGNGRENFIGTISGGMDSFKDADLFGDLHLLPGIATKYTLNINNGTGSGNYEKDAIIAISAEDAPEGKVFDKWIGDTIYISSTTSSSAMVTVPDHSISFTATYKETVSVMPDQSQIELKLYPNPFDNQLTIENKEGIIYNASVIDLSGHVMKSIDTDVKSIDLSSLPSGLYLIRITTDKGRVTRRITKK